MEFAAVCFLLLALPQSALDDSLRETQRLNGPLDGVVTVGDVDDYRTTPDGSWVFYRATQDENVPALYAVRRDRTQGPIRLSPPGLAVGAFEMGPNGNRVVFIAGKELYRASLTGSVLVLNGALVGGGSVRSFEISADGHRVAYLADEDSLGVVQLYVAPMDLPAGGQVLTPSVVAGGNVGQAHFTPDGTRLVLVGDLVVNDRADLYAVPVVGGAPPVLLSETGGGVIDFACTPDGTRALYRRIGTGIELFAVPVDASAAPLRLSAAMASNREVTSFLAVAGTRAIFRADVVLDDVYGLFSVPLDGSSAPLPLCGSENVGFEFYRVTPDGTRVVYRATADPQNRWPQLYVAPADGSATGVPITAIPDIGSSRQLHELAVTADSQTVVFRGQYTGFRLELVSVPVNGGATPHVLNGPLQASGDVREFALDSAGATVAYLADANEDETVELFAVPADGAGAPVVLSGALLPAARASKPRIVGDAAFFLADLAVRGAVEMYTAPLDLSAAPTALNGPMLSAPVFPQVTSFDVSADGEWIAYSTGAGVYAFPAAHPEQRAQLSYPSADLGAPFDGVRFAPDGSRVFFRGWFEGMHLFSAPRDGSQLPIQYSSGTFAFPFGAGAPTFVSGQRVLYSYSQYEPSANFTLQDMGGGNRRGFSGGGAILTPDGGRVFFLTSDFIGSNTLWVASLDPAGPATRFEPTDFVEAHILFALTPDGSRIVFRSDHVTGNAELFSRPSDGSAPAATLTGVVGPGCNVTTFLLTPDGLNVVFVSDRDSDEVYELYVVPSDGSQAPSKLSGPMVTGGDVTASFLSQAFWISPDGQRVIYRADQQANDRFELFSVPLDGSLAPVKLNTTPVTGGDVNDDPDSLLISPDGSHVVFLGDLQVNNRVELYSRAIDGSGALHKLSGTTTVGFSAFTGFRCLPDSSAVLFLSNRNGRDELWITPIDRTREPRLCCDLGPAGADVRPSFLPTPSGDAVLYRADAVTDQVDELFRTRLRAPRRRF